MKRSNTPKFTPSTLAFETLGVRLQLASPESFRYNSAHAGCEYADAYIALRVRSKQLCAQQQKSGWRVNDEQTQPTVPVPTEPPAYRRIDHVAFAVRDLQAAIAFFTDVLGFSLVRRRHIEGARTGMITAEMQHNGLKFVLCQGTEPESQVSQLIAHNGPGVAHIALEVDDPYATTESLSARGLSFDTTVIEGPGLQQVFSSRCTNTGVCFEFIRRTSEEEFLESNVQQLFDQLERSGKF